MTLKYDAILIPGGGIKKDGSLPEWTKRRLDKAIEIFSETEYIITLSAGTTHKPPVLDKKDFPIFESVAAANYLIKKGINSRNILTEKISLDTIGNAYFTRVIHTEPKKIKKLAVITSGFHMARTKVIFKWIFSLSPLPIKYKLDFIEVSDKGIDKELINIRIEKEIKSFKQLYKTKRGIRTLSQFHSWLYTQHSAYTTDLKTDNKLSGKVLDTY